MSIASEITRLQGAKADLKTAIEAKGVTVPSATKLDGYAALVGNISTGTTPTGTKQISITQNGTTTEDVAAYASAEISVSVAQTVQVQTATVIPATNATSSNPLSIQMEPAAHSQWQMMVEAVEYPEVDSTLYGALYVQKCLWTADIVNTNNQSRFSGILRPNGTVGTDTEMAQYNATSGVVSLGGQWGTFYAGAEYKVTVMSWEW